ncbi:unnamed protein product, partial [Mesorhabditis spiculigera]
MMPRFPGRLAMGRMRLALRRELHTERQKPGYWLGAVGGASALLLGGYIFDQTRPQQMNPMARAADYDFAPPLRKDLPVFKIDEVKKHGKEAPRIWIMYKNGVYDVTEFVENHPGGDKILLAAGGSVEPFWAIYAQHKTKEVAEILEPMRIGNVDEEDLKNAPKADANDPFAKDPARHPALLVNSNKPFNAESPPALLMDAFLTPNELFFVRNHLPVPETDEKQHRVEVKGKFKLSVEDLKQKYEPVSVKSVVQCAGNRRADMNAEKAVQGLMWTGTAIGCAKWTGVRLRDVLMTAGVDPSDPSIKHVHFEGADVDPAGKPYGASIPFQKAMSSEVIIAYEMNGKEIPRDHGYPLRLIVPGNVGARQVKWLKAIHTSDVESPAHWQQKDYRVFSPAVQIGDDLKWDKAYSIQEYPVQSAFCVPAAKAKVKRSEEEISVAGYAWSGGGRGIIRVDVSADGGKTWKPAELEHAEEQPIDRMWAWTLWKTNITLPKDGNSLELAVKATDRAYNTQPDTTTGIWNVRGLINNAWHRVKVQIIDD